MSDAAKPDTPELRCMYIHALAYDMYSIMCVSVYTLTSSPPAQPEASREHHMSGASGFNLMCTTSPPAKSSTPQLDMKPPPHSQWHSGQ